MTVLSPVRAYEHKWIVLVCVGIGTFMSALDASVANIILPVVSRDFGASVTTVEWVVTIYLVVVSGWLLTFGRLGDMFGNKSLYVTGFGIFTASSLLAGLALNVYVLILFRVSQALGAAMLFSNSPAILTKNFPAEQRGQALGLQATMTYLGLTVGPSLGGWLTEQFSWHAVFFINVPIGLLGILMAVRFIPRETRSARRERFDILGAILFTIGMIALLLALNQGAEWGWTSPLTLGLFTGAMIIFGAFIAVERRSEFPMLDLALFRVRLFSASTATAMMNYICLYMIIFLLPFYLIQGRGYSPQDAGLILTAQPLIMIFAAPLSGILSDRIGSRILATLGMTILAGGLIWLARLGAESSVSDIVIPLAVVGLGTGIFVTPNNSALMGSAPRQRQGIAAGVLAAARNVGMVLGVGLAGAIFSTVAGASSAPDALYASVTASFLVAAGIAALGALTSAVR
ncbi:MFS transporter [Anaerolineae bacterium CFX7]|nr:MFS transporter [Anaerolineae bacterium CFX7]